MRSKGAMGEWRELRGEKGGGPSGLLARAPHPSLVFSTIPHSSQMTRTAARRTWWLGPLKPSPPLTLTLPHCADDEDGDTADLVAQLEAQAAGAGEDMGTRSDRATARERAAATERQEQVWTGVWAGEWGPERSVVAVLLTNGPACSHALPASRLSHSGSAHTPTLTHLRRWRSGLGSTTPCRRATGPARRSSSPARLQLLPLPSRRRRQRGAAAGPGSGSRGQRRLRRRRSWGTRPTGSCG